MKLKKKGYIFEEKHIKKCSLSDFISDESACRCESIAVLCGFHCCVCDGLYHGQTSVENGRLQFNSHIYCFFIFTGNIGEIETIRNVLQEFVSGREVGVGIAASQVISNVPAALLLSGFTKDYAKLLVGVNIEGLVP